MTFKKSMIFAVMAVALSLAAYAQGPAEVRKQAEASMVVTGHIRINADGGVATLDLDRENALPKEVSGLVRTAVPQWRFGPLSAAQGTSAAATMGLRVVAHTRPDGNYELSVRSANFGDYNLAGITKPRPLRRPVYPAALGYTNASASVYLLVRIGMDGKVLNASAEQVDLYVVASEAEMARMRDKFAKSAADIATHWRFNPITGRTVNAKKGVTARVPVEFLASGRRHPGYGRWDAYVPGPRLSMPWLNEVDNADSEESVFVGGRLQISGSAPRLLTKLGQG